MAEDPPGGRPRPEIELDQPAGRGVGYLGPTLAWAVVFADLGTSVYYVPAILYAQVGGLAPMFVLVATVAFVFVALEHLEIARRYPKGGGGVSAPSWARESRMMRAAACPTRIPCWVALSFGRVARSLASRVSRSPRWSGYRATNAS